VNVPGWTAAGKCGLCCLIAPGFVVMTSFVVASRICAHVPGGSSALGMVSSGRRSIPGKNKVGD
jgi:hypothetical protein